MSPFRPSGFSNRNVILVGDKTQPIADRSIPCDSLQRTGPGGKSLKRISPSSTAFAIMLIMIGIWGLAQNRFVAIWAPGIQPAGLQAGMIVVCSLISIGCGCGLLMPRHALLAMRVLLAFLLLWLVWCKGAAIARAPKVIGSWESLGETAVVLSASWVLAALPGSGAADRRRNLLGELAPRTLYGLAMIAFGIAHLAYISLTASLVPSWLGSPIAWVYLTAATYIAAGIALVANRLARPAAALSALQMALFGVLVWLPRIAGGAKDADTLNETALSFALAISGWVMWTAIERQSVHAAPTDSDPPAAKMANS